MTRLFVNFRSLWVSAYNVLPYHTPSSFSPHSLNEICIVLWHIPPFDLTISFLCSLQWNTVNSIIVPVHITSLIFDKTIWVQCYVHFYISFNCKYSLLNLNMQYHSNYFEWYLMLVIRFNDFLVWIRLSHFCVLRFTTKRNIIPCVVNSKMKFFSSEWLHVKLIFTN